MVVFPNAKINIGLYVTQKRPDGYHELQSVFYPLQRLHDALEIIPDPSGQVLDSHIQVTGVDMDSDSSQNLCVKAVALIRREFPHLPAIRMHLHKQIPLGAGMGGGSSDGAFTIRLLNNRFSLGLSENRMKELALQLGSDCPFFIVNHASLVTGRGEHIEPIELDLSGYEILVLNPGIHVSTAWAFGQLRLENRTVKLREWIQQPVNEWRHGISNDFEEPVMAAYPQIAVLKTTLYEAGALYASMSGSGSTIFGLFPKGQRPDIKIPPGYFQKWT